LPDFTKSPWPEILGVATLAAFLLAIVVPAVQWRLGRRRKELSYRVVSAEPLVSVHEADELRDRLVVTLDGQPAQGLDVRAVVVRVWNSGNEPINDTDFRTPGFLTYGKDTDVLTDGEIREQPTHANASAPRDPNEPARLLLQPVLLNRGQFITIRALIRGYGQFAMEGRIVGGVVKENKRGNTRNPVALAIVSLLVGVALPFGVNVLASSFLSPKTSAISGIATLFVLLVVGVAVGVTSNLIVRDSPY